MAKKKSASKTTSKKSRDLAYYWTHPDVKFLINLILLTALALVLMVVGNLQQENDNLKHAVRHLAADERVDAWVDNFEDPVLDAEEEMLYFPELNVRMPYADELRNLKYYAITSDEATTVDTLFFSFSDTLGKAAAHDLSHKIHNKDLDDEHNCKFGVRLEPLATSEQAGDLVMNLRLADTDYTVRSTYDECDEFVDETAYTQLTRSLMRTEAY